jgi:hypothetical protein
MLDLKPLDDYEVYGKAPRHVIDEYQADLINTDCGHFKTWLQHILDTAYESATPEKTHAAVLEFIDEVGSSSYVRERYNGVEK